VSAHRTILATATALLALFALVFACALSTRPDVAGLREDAAVQPPVGPPPKPEPMVNLDVSPDKARALNSAEPFAAGGPGPAARPLHFKGDGEARERAADCLAAAMYYEAGGDARGQYAVGQVVLNRARHPAFPSSVCGVVFQGAERSSGCQFTFTCDGALARIPPPALLAQAHDRAERMLDGKVAPEVGLATHYHTDWVRPYWSPELDKIAQVGTHLFYRWPGPWGGPGAMRAGISGIEPRAQQIAALFPAHRDPAAPLLAPTAPDGEPVKGSAALAAAMNAPPPSKPRDLGGGRFAVFMSPLRNDNVQAMAALGLCRDHADCRITGYLDNGNGMKAPVVFTFERDARTGLASARWDCTRFRRPTTTQCFDAPRARTPLPAASARPTPAAIEPLAGVRWKDDPSH